VCICSAELRIIFLVWGVVCYHSPIARKEEPGLALPPPKSAEALGKAGGISGVMLAQ